MVSSWLFGSKIIQRTTVAVALSAGLLSGCASIQSFNSSDDSFGVAVTDRTLAQRILDKSIENTAKINISRIDPTLYQRSRISVDSFYSTVLVTGEVPDEQTKQQVETIVSSMPDVKQFYNKLTVGNQKGTSYTVHDAYISSKVNAKILANNALSSSQVKVVTDDGIVYILGKLTPAQRSHLINIINSTVGIKELVLLNQLIDDNGAVIDESSITQETGLEPPAPVYTEQPPAQAAPVDTQNYAPPAQVAPEYQAPEIAPAAPTAEASTTQNSQVYPSPYIEMYKQDVSGW